ERCLGRAVASNPAITGTDAEDAFADEEDLHSREAREHIDPGLRAARGQPLREAVQRDDEVPVIAKRGRDDRQRDPAARAERVDAILRDVGLDWRACGAEIGNELAQRTRVEHGAREHVRAGLARLLQQGKRQWFAAVGVLQVGETERGREAGRATTDDQDVNVQGLTFHVCRGQTLLSSLTTLTASDRKLGSQPPLTASDPSSAVKAGRNSKRSPT